MIDERTEQLINRRLDGELTDDQALELDKALLRSPEARRRIEQYQHLDTLAAETLRAALERPALTPQRAEQLARATCWRSRIRHVAGLIAVAASVTLAVVVTGQLVGPRGPRLDPQPPAPLNVPIVELPDRLDPAPAGPRPTLVIEGPRRREQDVTRDIFGVFDEQTRCLYLLEANRSRTTEVPMLVNH